MLDNEQKTDKSQASSKPQDTWHSAGAGRIQILQYREYSVIRMYTAVADTTRDSEFSVGRVRPYTYQLLTCPIILHCIRLDTVHGR